MDESRFYAPGLRNNSARPHLILLLNRGASLSEIQHVLGHADPSTTKLIYAHYTPRYLRETVARCSASPAELVMSSRLSRRGVKWRLAPQADSGSC